MWKLTVCLLAAIAISNGSPIVPEKEEREMLCIVCTTLVHEVSEYVTDHSRQPGIKERMMGVCGGLPQGLEREECQAAVHAFSPRMVEFFLHSMDPTEICSHMKVCPIQEDQEKPQVSPMVGSSSEQAGPLCELCEFLIQTVDAYLKGNKTLAAINYTVYKVCNSLPETLKDTCLGFAPEIVKVLSGGADPKTACTDIKLCTSELGGWKSVSCPVCQQSLDAIMPRIAHEMCDFLKVCPVEEEEKCLGFAPSLVSILSEGADPKEACTKLRLCSETELGGETWSLVTCEICHRAVEAILPHGFRALCSHIDVCPALKAEKLEPVKKEQAGPLCELCEFLVQTIDAYLKDNKSEAAINATVYKVCNSLPGALKDTCLGFAPMLVQALANGLDPQKACTEIKLCTNSSKGWNILTCGFCQDIVHSVFGEEEFYKRCVDMTLCAKRPVKKEDTQQEPQKKVPVKEQAGPLCELCEFLVQTVDVYLKDNKSEAAINATVYKVCNTLPGALKDTCLGFAPMLVQALSNGLDPQKACTEIKLCTNSSKGWNILTCGFCQDIVHSVFGEEEFYKRCVDMTLCAKPPVKKEDTQQEPQKKVPVVRERRAAVEKLDLKCEACVAAVSTLDNDLYQDEDKVKKMLDDVCHRLPPPTDQKCLDYVDPNFDRIWENILRNITGPNQVCELLGLCPKPHVQLLQH